MSDTTPMCKACGSTALTLIKESSVKDALKSGDFAITDSGYGRTLAIYACSACGLYQCPDVNDVLAFYTSLEDPDYEEGAAVRGLQAQKLIASVLKDLGCKDGRGLRLLDVGAGSGILVDVARKAGFEAVGVEPSFWLAQKAFSKSLPVYQGVLPHASITETFDIVMLIDVIEHVEDPVSLMRSIATCLKPQGHAYVVTPDKASFFARVMGFRWWHYRVAHISYFDQKTLALVMDRAGLRNCGITRPGWYFTYAYLRERLMQYLPGWILPPAAGVLKNLTIPLNLRDAILMRCVRS
jgi:SAM-dependent methyltransferase